MTERTPTQFDGYLANPAVSYVFVQGDLFALDHTPQQWVWTVPPDVTSFTLQVAGGPGNRAPAGLSSPAVPVASAIFYDVPCTPGDEWVLEPGDRGGNVTTRHRGTLHGGDGQQPPFPSTDTDYGLAGGGASIVSRRRTSDEVFAIYGGQGGAGIDSDSHRIPEIIADEAPLGPVTIGGFTDLTGTSPGEDQAAVDGGGGGGGRPGGAAATVAVTHGESGGSWWPATNYSSLGGPPSPTALDIAGTSSWHPQNWPTGLVAIFFWRPTPRTSGFHIDVTPF